MFKKAIITLGVCVLVVCGGRFVIAERVAEAQDLTPEQRAVLQAQYDELMKEIEAQQKIIKDTQAKKNTLQGDVTLLNAQIKAAQAQIDAKNIAIKQLASQIAQKNVVIGKLSERIARGQESLASILRKEDQIEQSSIITIILSNQNLTSFLSDLDSFVSIKTELQDLFDDIRSAKAQTETEKADLAAKRNQTVDAKYVVETKKQQIATDKTQKQQLIAITANQEAEYKKILADRQAKAAAIRAALFPLRDASAISFGLALQYAQSAQKSTGVAPALVLAILTQESNLGANVGQCYLTDDATGAGVGKNTGTPFAKVMAPIRDVPTFLALASQLGFDPHRQVVSCPIAGVVGWGGAMGPAQFIPSTWKLYADRVAQINGKAVANPWDARDAITAMSIYLGELGAGAGGYTAQHTAAAKYYAGGAWAGVGQTYANQVMAKVAGIQSNIDFLANN